MNPVPSATQSPGAGADRAAAATLARSTGVSSVLCSIARAPELLYVYGQYAYAGAVADLPPIGSSGGLTRVLRHLQAIQGDVPYLCETETIPDESEYGKSIAAVRKLLSFASTELVSATEDIAKLAETEPWIDAEGSTSFYFELSCRPSFDLHDAVVAFGKTYVADVVVTVVYHRGRVFLTLTEVSGEEQPLVDSIFPHTFGRRPSVQLRAYGDGDFDKLVLWGPPPPGEEEIDDEDDEADLGLDEGLDESGAAEAEDDGGVGSMGMAWEDLSGEGYVQIYMVMQPEPGSMQREALFRFGNWVYHGKVDLGVPRLHLGDVPDVLPALQRQQGALSYLCEASDFPSDHPTTPVVKSFLSAARFLEREMVANEETLAAMAEDGMTSWIDAEWAASFFEMAFAPTPAMSAVEVIAAKIYFRSGVVLHCVWFQNSLYCVLSDIAEDAPLLDVAFPDVTARCRGAQVKGYERDPRARGRGGFPAALPPPVRLMVWEGRRRGVPGVGWGAVAAVESDLAQGGLGKEIAERARARAEREERDRARTQAALGGKRAAAPAATSAGGGAAAGGGKEDDGEGEGDEVSKTAEAEAPAATAPRSTTTAAARGAEDAAADAAAGKGAWKPAGAASGGGTGSVRSIKPLAGSGRAKPAISGAARAPHHLKPLSEPSRGRLLDAVPSAGGDKPAPFDPLTGKPRI